MHKDGSGLTDSIAGAVDLDRRTVNRAMAWSVPVIMGAVAAPGPAGSPPPPPAPTVTFKTVSGVVDSAGKVDFTLPITASAAGEIQFLQLDNGGANGLPTTKAFGAGDNVLTLSLTKPGATAGTMTLSYQVVGGASGQVSVPVSSAVPTLTWGAKSGLLDASNGTIAFTLAVNSSGPGKISFDKMDNASATGLPVEKTLTSGANTLTFSVTKSGSAPGTVSLSYTVDGGKTTQTVSIQVSYPTVAFSKPTGVLDPATSKISFTLPANSTGPGPVTFTQLNGNATGLPGAQQLVAGDNTVKFDVTRAGLTAGTNTLTYKVGNGAEQTLSVAVSTPTSYVSSRKTNANQNSTVDFEMTFSGSTSSKITIVSVMSGTTAWSGGPTGPLALSNLKLAFSAKRPNGNLTTAVIHFKIDGGPELTSESIAV